jgi:uncharacterized protein (DUF736 family)
VERRLAATSETRRAWAVHENGKHNFMGEQYDNERKVAIFKNQKGDNPKRPDYRGTMTLNGVEYKLSLWLRKSQKVEHYMQGSVEDAKRDTPPPARPAPTQPTQAAQQTADEDVPF